MKKYHSKPIACRATPRGVKLYFENGKRSFIMFPNEEDPQLYRKKFKGTIINYERDKFNPYQNKLYHVAVYGFSAYDRGEVEKMTYIEKTNIRNIYRKSQKIINRLKNEMLDQDFSVIFSKIFKSKSNVERIFKEKSNCEEYDGTRKRLVHCWDDENRLEFSLLGITKEVIISRLLKEGIFTCHDFPGLIPR